MICRSIGTRINQVGGFHRNFGLLSTAWDPMQLFAAGEQGVLFDTSDFSTMFQDSAGTTPVTAVEQPVGLILDKSKSLAVGPELVTNGDFSNGTTGWTLSGSASISGGVLNANSVTTENFATQSNTFNNGELYYISFSVTVTSGSLSVFVSQVAGSNKFGSTITTSGNKSGYVLCGLNGGINSLVFRAESSFVGTIDNVSLRKISGNHASQSTTTSRPVLSARVNLLTYSEQFDNAAWTKQFGTVTATNITSPTGTATGAEFTINAPGGPPGVFSAIDLVSGVSYTATVALKAGTQRYVQIYGRASGFGTTIYANFDLQTGTVTASSAGLATICTSLGNGWYRCGFTATTTSSATANGGIVISAIQNSTDVRAASYSGSTGLIYYIWGADLRPSNQASGLPAYQRIAAATDYDTSDVWPRYLKFDGTDDWLQTASINPGSVDKAQVFAGVRKLSDAARGIVVELGNTAGTDVGVFNLNAPLAASNSYSFRNVGNPSSSAGLADITSGYAAPITNVLTGLGDIVGDRATLRINGAQVTQSTVDQGTGNFSAFPLYIGRRGGTTLPFNGHLYGLIVRFASENLIDSKIASAERWIASKTGVQL